MTNIEKELYHSFLYFMKEANTDSTSKGYGLIADNTKNHTMASVAAVGFGLTAYVIGVENKYITYEEGLKRVIGTFKTFLDNVEEYKGFFIHFADMQTGKAFRKSEYSTIDTALFLNGAITCDSYFDEEDVHNLFSQIYSRIDFHHFVKDYQGRKVFHMAYNPVEGGDYRHHSNNPWIHQWEMYAEQLMLYFQAAGSDTIDSELANQLYLGFERKTGRYQQYEYIYSPPNALFIYQYSHAWFDFSEYVDASGFDWFENSKKATLSNRQYCIDNSKEFPTLNEKAWGLTACLTPQGYRNQHVLPNDLPSGDPLSYGVLPPSGALGSMPFTPKESNEVLDNLFKTYPEAFQDYGFRDGILIQKDGTIWISPDDIGINKGITLIMLDNYLHKTTWKYYMQHPIIQKAISVLHFRKK